MRNKIARFLRLISARRDKSFLLLQDVLGYSPKNETLFKIAFTHKSSPILDKEGKTVDNERLEFLGDAILDAVVSDVLYHQFPTKKEGFLTNIRARIVNRVFLNTVALELHLDKLIISTSKTHLNNILGNALEALIGAVYLDAGYKQCTIFVKEKVLTHIDDFDSFVKNEINFKSKLLEWSQKNRKDLEFEIINETIDKSNTPTFTSLVKVDGITFGKGKGTTKKESHQDASRIALGKLKKNKLL